MDKVSTERIYCSLFIDGNNTFSLQALVVYHPPLKSRIESSILFNEEKKRYTSLIFGDGLYSEGDSC
jgi:hypothetical protein